MAKGKFSYKEETEVVDWGIHRGHTIGHLIEKETGYITWCIKNFKQFKLYKNLHQKYLAVLEQQKTNI